MLGKRKQHILPNGCFFRLIYHCTNKKNQPYVNKSKISIFNLPSPDGHMDNLECGNVELQITQLHSTSQTQ